MKMSPFSGDDGGGGGGNSDGSILDSRVYRRKQQYLVEWEYWPLENATWEQLPT